MLDDHLHIGMECGAQETGFDREVSRLEGFDPRRPCGREIQIIKGHASKDYIQLFVWMPPRVTISRLQR